MDRAPHVHTLYATSFLVCAQFATLLLKWGPLPHRPSRAHGFFFGSGNRRSAEMLFQFNSLARYLPANIAGSLEIARVNCQAQRAVCQHFHEFQFPTIRILRRNMPSVIYQSFWEISYVAKWVQRYMTALRRLDGTREQFLAFTAQPHWGLAVFRDRGTGPLVAIPRPLCCLRCFQSTSSILNSSSPCAMSMPSIISRLSCMMTPTTMASGAPILLGTGRERRRLLLTTLGKAVLASCCKLKRV